MSKMVSDKNKACLAVEQSVHSHGTEVANRLTERWSPLLDVEQPMPDVLGMMNLAVEDLAQHRIAMVEADKRNLDELGHDAEVRGHRNQVTTGLGRTYFRLRDLYASVYTPEAAEAMGFERVTSRDPERLLLQVERVIEKFSEAETRTPDSPLESFEVDPRTIVQALEPGYRELRDTLVEVRRERRQADRTQIAKNEAIERYDARFLAVARWLEMLYTLAGMPDLADRVRPSLRRPGTREVDETPEEVTPPTGDAPVEG